MEKDFLRTALAEESRAYGFTIAFWGSGALLINYSGLPNLTEALLYGIGAITGFGLLTLYAYSRTFSRYEKGKSEVMVLSMIHYIAALIPLTAAYYLARLGSPLNFFTAGLSVSILYNLGMVVEERLSEEGKILEEKLGRLL